MKIYIVERATGEYSDYRTWPITYATDKATAEAFAEAATKAANTMREKYEKIWRPLRDIHDFVTEEYDKAESKTVKLKSKFDPMLTGHESTSVSYAVIEVKEIK